LSDKRRPPLGEEWEEEGSTTQKLRREVLSTPSKD
jgi:hypothetical protein